MALLDIFKKSPPFSHRKLEKKEPKREAEKVEEARLPDALSRQAIGGQVKSRRKVSPGVKKEPAPNLAVRPGPKKISGIAYRILKEPHVTEKATDLIRQNQYVFKVWESANKTEIKKAVEDLYGVNVLSIRIIKVPRRKRRLGRVEGWRKGYKKAIVRLKEGQKIEVLPR